LLDYTQQRDKQQDARRKGLRPEMADDDAALLQAALRQLKLKGEAVLSLPKAESEAALAETVAFLNTSLSAHADVTVLRQPSPQDPGQALVLIRNRDELRELRVCVIGNVRSRLIGAPHFRVLTRAPLFACLQVDAGKVRRARRNHCFRLQHPAPTPSPARVCVP
jgi:hypothetical protein